MTTDVEYDYDYLRDFVVEVAIMNPSFFEELKRELKGQ